jgi:protein-disulfide isomerase
MLANVRVTATALSSAEVFATPAFFIDGRRHHGAYDIDHLSRAVRAGVDRASRSASAG